MTTTRLLIAVSVSSWLGCALFRPDPNLSLKEHASRDIGWCVQRQLLRAKLVTRAHVYCTREVDAYCAAVGQPPGCQDGRDEYHLRRLWLEPPPNLNHVGAL